MRVTGGRTPSLIQPVPSDAFILNPAYLPLAEAEPLGHLLPRPGHARPLVLGLDQGPEDLPALPF